MKRIMLAVAMLMAVCSAAFAQTVMLNEAKLTLELPAGWQEEELTDEDIREGCVSCWSSDGMQFAAYVTEADGTLEDILAEEQADTSNLETGRVTGLGSGLQAIYVLYKEKDQGETYFAIDYCLIHHDQLVELEFYMDDPADRQQADSIVRTLTDPTSAAAPVQTASAGTGIALSGTRMALLIPDYFQTEEISADDAAEGMVGYWYDNILSISVYVSNGEGETVDSILEELKQDEDYAQTGLTTMPSGIVFAYGVLSYTDEGEQCIGVDYYTVLDGNEIGFEFGMNEADKTEASAEAARIIETVYLVR